MCKYYQADKIAELLDLGMDKVRSMLKTKN